LVVKAEKGLINNYQREIMKMIILNQQGLTPNGGSVVDSFFVIRIMRKYKNTLISDGIIN